MLKDFEDNGIKIEFPSPFGVLFFFILSRITEMIRSFKVSVSFRSFILFYQYGKSVFLIFISSFPSPFGVLFFFILINL